MWRLYGEREKRRGYLIFKPHFDIVEVLKYMVRHSLATFSRIQLKPEIQRELKKILSEYLEYT